jgi:hypothetical protein
MPTFGQNLQQQLQQVADHAQTTVSNIRDRYYRQTPANVGKIDFPDINFGMNEKRGMLMPMLSISEELPIENAVIFQFNPDEINYEKKIDISQQERTGFSYDIPFWAKSGSRTISFRLLLDATAGTQYRTFNRSYNGDNQSKGAAYINTSNITDLQSSGCLPAIQRLEAMQYPLNVKERRLINFVNGVANVTDMKQFSTIPFVVFSYGNLMAITYLTELRRKDVHFNKELNPDRCEMDITLRVLEVKPVNTEFVNRIGKSVIRTTNDTK